MADFGRFAVSMDDGGRAVPLPVGQLFDGFAVYRPRRHPDGTIADFVCQHIDPGRIPFLPPEEQMGRGLVEMFPFIVASGEFARYVQVMETGAPAVFISSSDVKGRQFVLELRAVRADELLLVTYTDVADRVLAEQEAAQRLDDYASLAEGLPYAVVLYDAELRIRYINATATSMWGRSVAIGRSIEPLEERLPDFVANLRRVLTTRERYDFEYPFGDRLFSVQFIPGLDGGGTVRTVLNIARDITEERRTLVEQRELEARLQQSARVESLGVLAAGMAHDFNNLLVGILGNAELVLADLPEDSPLQALLQHITTSADRAAELTGQMLSYAGHRTLEIERVDLTGLIGDTLQLMRSTLAPGATVVRELQPGLPAVLGDPGQLSQVVMNLVINASDSLAGLPGTIMVGTSQVHLDDDAATRLGTGTHLRSGPHVLVQVRDTGEGMDEDTLDRLFEPFFSLRPMRRGLGMSVVHGVVRNHNGAIAASSRPGVGSVISVYLPVAPAPVASPEPVPVTNAPVVMVVDDDDGVRDVAARMLTREGYQVVTHADGHDALAWFRGASSSVALVMLDVTMPGMSGREVLAELQRHDASVPVIMMSGYSPLDFPRLNDDAGIAGFLQKPFRSATMLEAVENALRIVLVSGPDE